jgi:predicted ATPase/class 3 adenylate cyclase
MIEALSVYIPMDRRQALARGASLPERPQGAALFADISGFTPLTEGLVRELGPQRGAEELTIHLNLVYHSLITELHRFGGSVIGFSGDAITCWFDDPSTSSPVRPYTGPGLPSQAQPAPWPGGQPAAARQDGLTASPRAAQAGLRATACALAMQGAMVLYAAVPTPSGRTVSLAMKAAVATGAVRRFLVGDPDIQVMDVLAGVALDQLAAAEHQAGKGEVVLDAAAAAALGEQVEIAAWRHDEETGQRFGVVAGLLNPVSPSPWPQLPSDALSEEQVRPWLLPLVYERLRSGQGEFLAELRPAVALFLRFGGIDYNGDEAAGAKLDAYVRQVQRTLAGYESNLLQLTIGDKGSYLYAAFGAPLAHEDDAVRAASAALELSDLTTTFDFITPVQIGISQGRMRTGAYGGMLRRTYGVLGDEVNLAARLMQAAAPGQILVSKVTQQSAGEAFNWESLPDLKVKGKAEPVPVFSLAGLRERQTIRLQEPRYALPMVGREAELALIEEKLEQVLQGRGQLIGVSAEAGMGKSRLVAEVIRLAYERELVGYGGECQSYGTHASYLAWQSIWRGFFDVDSTWPVHVQAQALETQLGWIDPALAARAPLLGAVLNLPIPDNELTRSFDAKLRKTSLEALLVDCLRARARQMPLLLVLEDCHWLDPLSHDLLEVVGRAILDLPVLLVLAYRPPELERLQAPRLSQLPHFLEIGLADFTPQEAERLIGLKLMDFFGPQTEVPQDLVERITARAQGNPFYIEELLNYLQDRGIDPHDSRALEHLDLPSSLHSLILSRIDQLTESQKITLKVASVIGRLFRAAMLWGVYPQLGDQRRVEADLDALSRLELTPLDAPKPELTYLFKHIVTQEVAYETLPFATRAMLHDQIGQYIERTYLDTLDQYVDLLAYHYDRSQNEAKKREYLLKAGEAAQADYANAAAIDYYRRVLPLLLAQEQVAVMLKLGQVLELVGEWDEAGALYRQALELAEQLGDRQAQARCQTAQGELFRKQSQYTEAAVWLERGRAVFEELGDEAGVGQVLHLAGTLAAQQGDYQTARALYEQSLVIRRKLADRPRIAGLLSNLGIVARFQADYDLARALNEEALAIRRELGDRWAIANSLNNQGTVALDQGDYAEARARLEEAVVILREIGDRWYYANSLNNLGNVARAQADYATARALYTESLVINRDLGDKWALAYLLEDIGGLSALQGEAERALRLVGAADTLREAIGAPLPPAEQASLERMLESARQQLGEAGQAAAWSVGRALSLEEAVSSALAGEAA